MREVSDHHSPRIRRDHAGAQALKSSIARLAAPVAVAAALLVAGRESPLAECMMDIELSSAILGGSFVGCWADKDSERSWVAILRVEREEWRPDSVFIANGLSGKDLERHYFRAQPLAVLSGSLRPDSLWLTNGVLRRPTKGDASSA